MSENTVNQNHNNQNINYNSSAEKALMLELLMSNICNAVKIGCLLIETDEKNGTNLFDTATGKKKKSIGDRLIYTQDALRAMNKESKFAIIICASLVLFVAGAVIAVLINNVFLILYFIFVCFFNIL